MTNKMKLISFSAFVSLLAACAVQDVSAFSMAPVSPRVGVSTFMSVTMDSADTNSAKSRSQISHLQKKLRYWKQQQKAKESEYRNYQVSYSIDHKLKPVYRREGKIDHYTAQPVFDQETERIKTEIWSIKEQIKVTQAKLHEEWRVEKMEKKTANRLAHVDEEIMSLKEQAKKEYDELMAKAKAEQELLLAKAKAEHEEHEMMMKKAREEQERISREAAMKLQNMQQESTARLTEKERQIAAVTADIARLTAVLKENRDELQSKEICLDTLEKELEQKKDILHHLSRERASIRALVKQSWRVLKDRFKKHILHKEELQVDIEEMLAAEVQKEPAAVQIEVNGMAVEVNGEVADANGKEKPSVNSEHLSVAP